MPRETTRKRPGAISFMPGGPGAGHVGEGEQRTDARQAHLAAVGVAGDQEVGRGLVEREIGRVAEDQVESLSLGGIRARWLRESRERSAVKVSSGSSMRVVCSKVATGRPAKSSAQSSRSTSPRTA